MIDRFGDQPKIVWQTNLPKLPLYVSVGSVYRAVISPSSSSSSIRSTTATTPPASQKRKTFVLTTIITTITTTRMTEKFANALLMIINLETSL